MVKAKSKKSEDSSSRLSAVDWEEAALLALVAGGPPAVAVEPLARSLGVTKGSFYWHFPDRDALFAAALARWEAQSTEGLLAEVETAASPHERLRRLFEQVTRLGPGSELHAAISAAAGDPIVKPVLERVSARRLGYLAKSYRALGLRPGEARHRAVLAHAACLGLLHLRRESQSELPELGAYSKHVLEPLIPG